MTEEIKSLIDDLRGKAYGSREEAADTIEMLCAELDRYTTALQPAEGAVGKAVLLLTLDELRHLQNDVISYIWTLEGAAQHMNNKIESETFLLDRGYYDRQELLNKLNCVEAIYFPKDELGYMPL